MSKKLPKRLRRVVCRMEFVDDRLHLVPIGDDEVVELSRDETQNHFRLVYVDGDVPMPLFDPPQQW